MGSATAHGILSCLPVALFATLLLVPPRIHRCTAYQILGAPPEQPPGPTPPHAVTLRHLGGRALAFDQQREEEDGGVSMAGTAWEASSVLADYVTNPRSGIDWDGKLVVELGAGIGICSVAAALMGAEVIATDASRTALKLLRENAAKYAEECRLPVTVLPLLWGDHDMMAELPQPDVVLASDVVYHGSTRDSLRETIGALCPSTEQAMGDRVKMTQVLLAHTWRTNPDEDEEYFRSYEHMHGFKRTEVDPGLLPEGYQRKRPDGRLPVSIFCFHR